MNALNENDYNKYLEELNEIANAAKPIFRDRIMKYLLFPSDMKPTVLDGLTVTQLRSLMNNIELWLGVSILETAKLRIDKIENNN